jgi:hypothetical protein
MEAAVGAAVDVWGIEAGQQQVSMDASARRTITSGTRRMWQGSAWAA